MGGVAGVADGWGRGVDRGWEGRDGGEGYGRTFGLDRLCHG